VKNRIVFFCAVFAAATLAACGQPAQSSQPETTPSAQAAQATEAASVAATAAPAVRFQPEDFTADGMFLYYKETEAVTAENGIDLSSYSGDADWDKVKAAGVSFAMVRLGGRGYGSEGALYADDRAAEYMQGAQAAGIKTGGYFFSQATTPEEAREEAAYCKQLLGELTPDYPIAYDWEFIKDDEARTAGMTVAQTTACARAFFDEIKSYGWTPMLYAGEAEMTAKYDMAQLGDCEIWYTEYAAAPVFPYTINMWQYANTGVIDGIEGNVDLDIRFIYHT